MVSLEDAYGRALRVAGTAQDGVTARGLDGVDDGGRRGRAFYREQLVLQVGLHFVDSGELVECTGNVVHAAFAVHGHGEESL